MTRMAPSTSLSSSTSSPAPQTLSGMWLPAAHGVPGVSPPCCCAGFGAALIRAARQGHPLEVPLGTSSCMYSSTQEHSTCTELVAHKPLLVQQGGAEHVLSLTAPSRLSCEGRAALLQICFSSCCSSLSQMFPLLLRRAAQALLLPSLAVLHHAAGQDSAPPVPGGLDYRCPVAP